MLLYDWKKIFEASAGNVNAILLIFKMLVNKETPKNKRDKIYMFSAMDFSGESFLLHPDVLLYNSYKYSNRDVAQYLAIASFRSLAEYKIDGELALDIVYLSNSLLEFINENSLLRIKGDKIHFIYEEVNQKEIH